MKLFTLYLISTALFMACCHVNNNKGESTTEGKGSGGPIIGIDLGTTYSW